MGAAIVQSYRLTETQGDLEAWPLVDDGPSEYRILWGDPRACGRLDLGAGSRGGITRLNRTDQEAAGRFRMEQEDESQAARNRRAGD